MWLTFLVIFLVVETAFAVLMLKVSTAKEKGAMVWGWGLGFLFAMTGGAFLEAYVLMKG